MTSLLTLQNALPLERWHKTNFVAGFLLLVISLLLSSPWLPPKLIGMLGLGQMFMGLGTWKLIREEDGGTAVQRILGYAFWLVGLALLFLFVVNLGLLLYRG